MTESGFGRNQIKRQGKTELTYTKGIEGNQGQVKINGNHIVSIYSTPFFGLF